MKVTISLFIFGLVLLASSAAKATTTNQKPEQKASNLYSQRNHHQREQDYIGYRRWEEAARQQAEYNRQQNELARIERVRQAQESARNSIPELESKRDYLALGQAWRTLEEWDRSLDAANKAVAAYPNVVGGYTLRASLRKRLKNIAGALADYNQAIIINPNSHVYYQLRGELKKSFDRNGAIEDFRMAMKAVRVDNRYNLIRDSELKILAKELQSLGATE
jgi:tetratricopeptide (TPR) repeat protein